MGLDGWPGEPYILACGPRKGNRQHNRFHPQKALLRLPGRGGSGVVCKLYYYDWSRRGKMRVPNFTPLILQLLTN